MALDIYSGYGNLPGRGGRSWGGGWGTPTQRVAGALQDQRGLNTPAWGSPAMPGMFAPSQSLSSTWSTTPVPMVPASPAPAKTPNPLLALQSTGQAWAGGSPNFNEKTGQYTNPQLGALPAPAKTPNPLLALQSTGQAWAGGSPNFNEKTGQYTNPQLGALPAPAKTPQPSPLLKKLSTPGDMSIFR